MAWIDPPLAGVIAVGMLTGKCPIEAMKVFIPELTGLARLEKHKQPAFTEDIRLKQATQVLRHSEMKTVIKLPAIETKTTEPLGVKFC